MSTVSNVSTMSTVSTVPTVPEPCSHVLAELDSLDPLLSALRLDSSRLKCTCLAASRRWLALGTSAGGLHLIQREGWKQRLILTHKEGAITQVACCPHDEDFVAVALSKGLVLVWELQLERRGRPERVCMSWEHRGHDVTALCWDTSSLRLFVGDSVGKVSCLRVGSSRTGKGAAFVIFPVQTITTVDSRVVQLGYQDGRLLVSSLTRCYLCDTEREKFWRIGNKERDGEYGACFFPQIRSSGGTSPLICCARPGSRVWEASFSGEVLSTHQFKQLLACAPLPLVTHRCEPQYSPAPRSPQSIAFPRLLFLSDQYLLTWTDSAIYIFVPQSAQVLLWTEVKDLADVAVVRNELFCLHGDGRLSHLSFLPVERCVERLLRRESWVLAATVCCLFQHSIAPCRARKALPMERLEHLKAQLDGSAQRHLIGQLEEVMSTLEPVDSASSSRRSSISSHESFNVLDCGIYRVISRKGSQSDEDTSSLVSQSLSEEERLRELSSAQEEEPIEQEPQPSDGAETDRAEPALQFLPLSFRPKPPRATLQAVRDSVSSFVKKTTEKINTLQMNSDLWPRPDPPGAEVAEEPDPEAEAPADSRRTGPQLELQELREATERAVSQIQDPLVLLDPTSLALVLDEWLLVLDRALGADPCDPPDPSQCQDSATEGGPPAPEEEGRGPGRQGDPESSRGSAGAAEEEGGGAPGGRHGAPAVRVSPPWPVPAALSELATLALELGRLPAGLARRGFFLLDLERARRACLLPSPGQPAVRAAYTAGLLELTRTSPVVRFLEKGDLLKSLRHLRELQPWSGPLLLAHLHRLYERHGELAVRSFGQFYPTILPADVMAMSQRSHFLAYLDNLVQSQPEERRPCFLASLLQPEALRQDWLELALSHDAPQRADTLTPDGRPRWRSHLFRWGYSRLISLLIGLPADLASKQQMAETCRSHGFWLGYLTLCSELDRRAEAFSTVAWLDDMSLLEGPGGVVPESVDEWKLLLQLSQRHGDQPAAGPASRHAPGNGVANGSADRAGRVSPENVTLRLACVVGPDRALSVLEECGARVELGPRSGLVCELLRVAERRQRALIQAMLERCDRFLWSQQA